MSLQEETTSLRTKEVDLKKQEREAAQGERGEGEKRQLQPVNPAPENPQSKAEPAAKTPIPERVDKVSRATGAPSTRQRPLATRAVPAEEKVVQATPSSASFPHPTTRRRQMLKGLGLQV